MADHARFGGSKPDRTGEDVVQSKDVPPALRSLITLLAEAAVAGYVNETEEPRDDDDGSDLRAL